MTPTEQAVVEAARAAAHASRVRLGPNWVLSETLRQLREAVHALDYGDGTAPTIRAVGTLRRQRTIQRRRPSPGR